MKKNIFKLFLLAGYTLISADVFAAAGDARAELLRKKLAAKAVREGAKPKDAEEAAIKAAAAGGSAAARIKVLKEEIARPDLDFSLFGEDAEYVRRFVGATEYTKAQLATLLEGVDFDGEDEDARTESLARVLFLSRIGNPPRDFEKVFVDHHAEVFEVLTGLDVRQLWRIFDTVESDGDADRSSIRAIAMARRISDVVAQEAYDSGILYADFEGFIEVTDDLESSEAKDSHVRTSMFMHRAAGYDQVTGAFRDFSAMFGGSAREIGEEARVAKIPVAQFSAMADDANALAGVNAIERTEHVRAAIEHHVNYSDIASAYGVDAGGVARDFLDLQPDFNSIMNSAKQKGVTAEDFADLYDGIDPANRKADLRRALNTYPDL